MKLTFLFLLIIFIAFNIFGQEMSIQNSRYIVYFDKTIIFKDNNVIEMWKHDVMDSPEIAGKYTLENINRITFININWDNRKNERFLILISENICYLYNGDNYPYFRGFSKGAAPGEAVYPYNKYSKKWENEITATSFLTEGRIRYTTEDLNENIGMCWAEGVSGQGINETLFLKMIFTKSIHISTGFVSYFKPHLFKENSRPKTIELSVVNKYSIIINLEDTPNFQTINLPEQLGKNDVLELKILDVYQGTKYENTCINTILFDTAR
jgi:hypothetical protein